MKSIAAMSLLLAGLTGLAALPAPARGAGDDPLPTPTVSPGGGAQRVSPQALVNQGLEFAHQQKWTSAEARYRAALAGDPNLPEAWNGLGHSLKGQKRFTEALAAYDEALRLRPNYPQALEYLGETYVQMGRVDDARAVQARLASLSPELAARLGLAIEGKTQSASAW